MIGAVLPWSIAILFAVPLAVFTVEVCAGLRRERVDPMPAPDCTIAVLIPAHDEATGIEVTIARLLDLAPPACRIVVIADNCTDDTAARARAMGVDVVERADAARRGKGHALACGRAWLARDPPDAVIVLDADCRFRRDSIERLAAAVIRTGRPAQAFNTLDPDLLAPPAVQISSFAMIVKNVVRSRGMARLGGPSLLTGTGMAFPWAKFRDAALATDNIVEDLALGIELTRRGIHATLVPGAAVLSAPAHLKDMLEQRSRWERGFLQTAKASALPIIAGALRHRSWPALLLGLHMLVPPLAMLLAASSAGLALLAFMAAFGSTGWPATVVATTLGSALVATAIAWLCEGRDTLSLASLAQAPGYVLWKLPMYIGFAGRGRGQWTRTKRRLP